MDTTSDPYFDPETVALLREILQDAWFSLPLERRATRTILAERILKCAAQGERDPERLRDAALTDVAVEVAAA